MESTTLSEIQRTVDKLVAISGRQGYVTPDDIAGMIPEEAAMNEEFVDAVYAGLLEVGVVLREDADDDVPVSLEALASDRGRRTQPLDGTSDSDDTISLYLREIGSIPLLTAQDEHDLARLFEQGRKARLRLDDPAQRARMSDAEQHVLWQQVADGDNARHRLHSANLRLVVHIAKKYMNHGVPFTDLIQEGNLGLMKAAEKFDWRRGLKFSTYATWWIRQSVTRALADQARTIRVPVHMSELIAKVMTASRNLEQDLGGRKPSADEIAAEVGLPPQRVEQILQIARSPVSMDRPVGEEADSEYIDLISDKESPEPNEHANRELLREALEDAISNLTEREQQVLIWRFGLVDDTPCTLEEVGEKLGVTRERVRQIETKAIRRLRHPTRSNKLREYLR
ncbi:hypothetical protein DCC79_14110 [bacterium]|nr:sigma-70 family RNA polymerase sigma factor [Chloroflexi bacterium CFX6]RIL08326.1 MAG: hypothetical protein DCC79_14110 [bacterium]